MLKKRLLYYLITEPILPPFSYILSFDLPVNMANPTPTITSKTTCSYYFSFNLLFNILFLLFIPNRAKRGSPLYSSSAGLQSKTLILDQGVAEGVATAGYSGVQSALVQLFRPFFLRY